MTLSATISIQFPGNAAAAFTFYQQVFGGELAIMRYQDFPPMDMPITPPGDAVAHADLTTTGFKLVGGDAVGDMLALSPSPYSIMLGLDSLEDARALIDKLLVDGGALDMPFELAPWGDHYGQVTDQFGVRWEVIVGGAQAQE